jgi:hypothetical protein
MKVITTFNITNAKVRMCFCLEVLTFLATLE